MEYIIYTDESEQNGDYFSNFYGGALVRSVDLARVVDSIRSRKASENLHGEVKWIKVTENYLAKYISLMDTFFNLVADDAVKVRIMFTQNRIVPLGLTTEHRDERYHRLYYQFLKHAFGLKFSNPSHVPVRVRINMDQLPREREANAKFKSFVESLNNNPEFRRAGVRFHRDQIAEVQSHDHEILQCLDIVLGSMSFRLNDKHKAKLEGSRQRGKRTIAKEKLYKHIQARIGVIYPGFNVGMTTGKKGDVANIWHHPYRHWKFIPSQHEIDGSKSKP